MIVEPPEMDATNLLMEKYHALLARLSLVQQEAINNKGNDPRNQSILIQREIQYWFSTSGELRRF